MPFIRRAASVTSAAALTLVALTGSSNAGPTGLFNTGVNSLGVPLTPPTIATDTVDLHYTLVANPPLTGMFEVLNPFDSWVGDDSASSWIGVGNLGNATAESAGKYDYQTSFMFTSPADITFIAGQLAADNAVTEIIPDEIPANAIFLNPPCSVPGTCFTGFLTSFELPAGDFTVGMNTLDFIVRNDGSETGLRVEFVPEPPTLALLGSGLLLLGLVRHRPRAGRVVGRP